MTKSQVRPAKAYELRPGVRVYTRTVGPNQTVKFLFDCVIKTKRIGRCETGIHYNTDYGSVCFSDIATIYVSDDDS